MAFHVPERFRIRTGSLKSNDTYGNNGAFQIPPLKWDGGVLWVIASSGLGWEHVSVHARRGKKEYTPSWDEMCYIKDLFWDEEDVVMQLHPRKSQYVTTHKTTLHLWRPTTEGVTIPEPEHDMVGPLKDEYALQRVGNTIVEMRMVNGKPLYSKRPATIGELEAHPDGDQWVEKDTMLSLAE